jgi:hypothetical protein
MAGRYGQRRPAVGTTRGNKYPGECWLCGQTVPALAGIAVYRSNGWQIQHMPQKWHGSPVSGGWSGGCPKQSES